MREQDENRFYLDRRHVGALWRVGYSEPVPNGKSQLAAFVENSRRRFHNASGPWYRCRLFEAFGSRRYSQPGLFGMEQKLAELMPWEGGTYVEAGAHNGFTQSNTYYLERHRGWSGVLVEPIPELRRLCEQRRPRSKVVGCALVGPSFGEASVSIEFGDLMSAIGDQREHAEKGLAVAGSEGYSVSVPARTLSSVLADSGLGRVDLMVLDVEGHELDALAGLDCETHGPRYMLIEALDRANQQPAIDNALSSHYEFVDALSDYDLLYRRRE